MALPKIQVPLFDVTIPSTGKAYKFKPFLVKEEKILLIAQASGIKSQVIDAMKQVINNCIVRSSKDKFNVDDLTTFDLEYLFLKIRAKSVDNNVKLAFHDNEDDKDYEFEVDIDTIEIQKDPKHSKKIKIDNEVGLVMKYPPATIINQIPEDATEIEISDIMIETCIEQIYDKENVYLVSETPQEELKEFIEGIPAKTYSDIQKFFETMPKLYHKIEYVNSKGTERVIELTSIDDFFTLA